MKSLLFFLLFLSFLIKAQNNVIGLYSDNPVYNFPAHLHSYSIVGMGTHTAGPRF